ncbi:expressed unknown protein [Seminavis robusta]|uniref:Uncharacterized protein n=1 Tax=Seminavis robusta TaxID=568900 RepID=A0A9N8F0S5_9STRA|nr:expressed unknown protein [Seminavis robusta]|eukprot:Sro2250_g320790.1 n/a (143) ;mRNA; f:5121-5549
MKIDLGWQLGLMPPKPTVREPKMFQSHPPTSPFFHAGAAHLMELEMTSATLQVMKMTPVSRRRTTACAALTTLTTTSTIFLSMSDSSLRPVFSLLEKTVLKVGYYAVRGASGGNGVFYLLFAAAVFLASRNHNQRQLIRDEQ